ncbi:hypothetical protein AAKU55_000804 [Oxalobacteraceae bacterium GrIS 1.11]
MRKIAQCLAAGLCLPMLAHGAPQDAFLSAEQGRIPWHGQLEAGADFVSKRVDVFNLRRSDGAGDNSSLGDYHGAHLAGGVAVTPRLWLDGAWWQRKIDTHAAPVKLDSWQVAAQYRIFDAAGYRPAVALRLGAWGDQSGAIERSSGFGIGGVQLASARLLDVKDRQYQLDAVATWPLAERTELSAFAGAGSSRVSVGGVSATALVGSCLYQLSFGPDNVVGTCDTPTMNVRFSTPNSTFGFDFNQEFAYTAKYYQTGFSLQWHDASWQLRGGYQYQRLDRDGVDDIIVSRGGTAYRHNHILAADLRRALGSHLALFLRGQYMSNQFTGELPMAYNSLTASTFRQRYGIVSAGVILMF